MAPHQMHTSVLASSDRYYLRAILPEDTNEVFDFLVKYYYPYEPINQSVNRIPVNIYQCSHGDTIKEGFSLMAVEKETGKLIGVSIQGLARPGEDVDILMKAQAVAAFGAVKVAKSFEILAVLEREADMWTRLGVDRSLRVLATAVHSDYQGLGLGAAFVVASARLAQKHMIGSLSIITSSFYFANACRRLGGQLVHSVRYAEFTDDKGVPHLPVKAPHVAVTMWAFDPADLSCRDAVARAPRRRSAAAI
ncbi:Dopamine N-acetyltransferase [Frankliniella fusca]|uniref:Dopamine N-acetyltransferase n=1 Tax=Frankliniella fusca TaxID=407009 RepID=A0AAE1HGN0_9NEOP|nr:Dopamine N-acetyltransferase [Frankliniella fusca]